MTIAFLGDSITMGYALKNPADRFSAVLCGKLGASEVNHGITGTLVARAGLSRSNGTSYIDRVGEMGGADFAVVYGGTNDYFWSDTPIEGNTPAHFGYALKKLAEELLKMYPKERILFLTPTDHHGIGNFWGGSRFNESSEHDTTAVNFTGHTMADYVCAIMETCGEYGIPVLNLHDTDFDWRKHTSDGCHPNPEGHRWICEKILETGFFDGIRNL